MVCKHISVDRVLLTALALLATRIRCELIISLDNTDYNSGVWTVHSARRNITVSAVVPGGVYAALEHARQLPHSVYYRFNDVRYAWVAQLDWTFERHFHIPIQLFISHRRYRAHSTTPGARWTVLLNEVDTVANVSINGQLIGTTVNQFVRNEFDATAAVRAGRNHIAVSIGSAPVFARRRYLQLSGAPQGYPVPPKCPPPQQHGFCHVNYVRKMQASFSWDWGPAVADSAIWGGVHLHLHSVARMRAFMAHVYPRSMHVYVGDKWHVHVRLRLHVTHAASATYTMSLDDGRLINSGGHINLTAGQSSVWLPRFTTARPLDNSDLWWPNGPHGKPILHRARLCVRFTPVPTTTSFATDDTTCRRWRLGFREVQLNQSMVDGTNTSRGRYFFVSINGRPLFLKGANWVPPDLRRQYADAGRIARLLTAARHANMNVLRVWGGGRYESDAFYRIADRLGLLVWQDLMFACAMYPTTPPLLNSVRREITDQVWRLQPHASVVLWAANNENEQALRSNLFGTQSHYERYHTDYVRLYGNTVRRAFLQAFNVTTTSEVNQLLLPSSPSNGRASLIAGLIADDPQSQLYGDVHHYDYTSDLWRPDVYPRPRLVSEYGVQSWPSLASQLAYSLPSDRRLQSTYMNHRQHHPFGNAQMLAQIGRHFRQYDQIQQQAHHTRTGTNSSSHWNSAAAGFEAFVYLSQIVQAQAVRVQTEHYRRQRHTTLTADGRGHTMGAIYWQLNSAWPAPSWSSLEYDAGRWKLLHHAARRFFADLLLTVHCSPSVSSLWSSSEHSTAEATTASVANDNDNESYEGWLHVHVVSDLPYALDNLRVRVTTYNWNAPHHHQPAQVRTITAVHVPAASSQHVWSARVEKVLPARGRQMARLQLQWANGSDVAGDGSQADLYVGSFAHAPLLPANVRVSGVSENAGVAGIHNRLDGRQRHYAVSIDSDAPAPFVWLQTVVPGRFSQNGFIQLQSRVVVGFVADEPIEREKLAQTLTVYSLLDVYQ